MGRNIWRWYQKNKNLCGGSTHFHALRGPWPGGLCRPPSPPRLVVSTLTIPALTIRTLTMLQRSTWPAGRVQRVAPGPVATVAVVAQDRHACHASRRVNVG